MTNSTSFTAQESTYQLLSSTKDFLNILEKDIRQARSTVDLQFYTFEADSIGKRVARELFKARKRGIRVRFIIDRFIDLSHNDYYIRKPRFDRKLHQIIIDEWRETIELIAKMKEQGIEIKRSNPLGFLMRKALFRNHKKIAIIDSPMPGAAKAYIGGTNLSEHNASWNDFMVRMTGKMVPVIQNDFDLTWSDNNIYGRTNKYADGIVLTDARGSAMIMPCLKDLIENAKKNILLESPYVYGKRIYEGLINAAKKGVNVSVIVPLNNNKRFFAPRGKYLKQLKKGGVSVYRFTKNNGMTHAKGFLVDDKIALFGSSNFNEFLSSKLCEINIMTKNKEMVRQLKEKLSLDMQCSKKEI
jgi:cardiolipin synthase A/B